MTVVAPVKEARIDVTTVPEEYIYGFVSWWTREAEAAYGHAREHVDSDTIKNLHEQHTVSYATTFHD